MSSNSVRLDQCVTWGKLVCLILLIFLFKSDYRCYKMLPPNCYENSEDEYDMCSFFI